jgi:hypothetical protein
MEPVNAPVCGIRNIPARREGTDRRVGAALALSDCRESGYRSTPQKARAVPKGSYGVNVP